MAAQGVLENYFSAALGGASPACCPMSQRDTELKERVRKAGQGTKPGLTDHKADVTSGIGIGYTLARARAQTDQPCTTEASLPPPFVLNHAQACSRGGPWRGVGAPRDGSLVGVGTGRQSSQPPYLGVSRKAGTWTSGILE